MRLADWSSAFSVKRSRTVKSKLSARPTVVKMKPTESSPRKDTAMRLIHAALRVRKKKTTVTAIQKNHTWKSSQSMSYLVIGNGTIDSRSSAG